ncbi:NUDIX domain-containing protein [Cytobacillus oceanisediminis]|uniref:NUDIX hydrolase n=1 Tax=Cytobacillus oceanisediminis TaxID=665099 RepID=UPI00203FF993|nr:NUDIX domain-containing protein [Cytobacillus oceanisediminis]MCM3405364.1 NUDIX domain-containing protein [Cytobacillus oceanisediminis]
METWDIYDKDRNLTDKQMNRGDLFEQGAYHLVIHVCLFNQLGEMLIQQRRPDKEDWKNMWDITVGGSAIAGETSQQAGEREVKEEIGYTLNLRNRRPALTVNFENGFDDYYLIETDLNISNLSLPTEEVKQVKWASKDDIINMISEGIFIPYHRPLVALLFNMRYNMGAHNQRKGQ